MDTWIRLGSNSLRLQRVHDIVQQREQNSCRIEQDPSANTIIVMSSSYSLVGNSSSVFARRAPAGAARRHASARPRSVSVLAAVKVGDKAPDFELQDQVRVLKVFRYLGIKAEAGKKTTRVFADRQEDQVVKLPRMAWQASTHSQAVTLLADRCRLSDKCMAHAHATCRPCRICGCKLLSLALLVLSKFVRHIPDVIWEGWH